MNASIQKTVNLRFGYVDANGNAHKEVVLRPSTADDLIKAEAVLISLRQSDSPTKQYESRSTALLDLALVHQCTVKIGDIAAPQLHHLRALRRKDTDLLVQALQDLDEGLEEGDEEGKHA